MGPPHYVFHSAVAISKGLAQNGNEGLPASNVVGMSRWGGCLSVTFLRSGRYDFPSRCSAARLAVAVEESLASGLEQPCPMCLGSHLLERDTAVPGGSSTACLPSFQHRLGSSSARSRIHHPMSEQLK